ncbi:hypothetical protein QZH41_020737 [Actinostola sp. cb2023]|nr:hypothetical protein QZH41_020737 [Actinostola sp. cb2023]
MNSLYLAVMSLAFLLGITDAHTGDRWVKLNKGSPVCFLCKNNHPGVFHSKHSGFMTAVKLVHRSGEIRCGAINNGAKHNSFFGCHMWPGLQKHPMNVVVTNSQNQIKFPTSGMNVLPGSNPAFWYALDGVNSRSKTIVLQHSFSHPYYVNKGQVLKVWYGEDLLNQWEADNVGRVCVHVYGYFI